MKKRKTFKGMTLMEIIISLAILSVLTLVLVQTSSTINMYLKSAKNVNQKTVQQAPVAEVGHKSAGEQIATNVEIRVERNGAGDQSFSAELRGNAYKVGEPATEVVTDAEGNETVIDKNELGGDLNMQYIVDLEAVTQPTTAPTT